MTTLAHNLHNRLGWIIAAISGTVIFAAFTVWGGIPSDEQAGIFWAQLLVLFLVICAFILLFWHLLIRPLAPNLRQPKSETLSLKLRQRIVLIQTGGFVAIIVAGFWDELWHRAYGIPFGEDFFWRPHLLMYFGLGTVICVAFWALLYLNRRLKGSFQQRFRSNTLIGLFILNAAFMLYALTADPFWHWTFGQDLTAWSVPHLILLTSFVTTLLITIFASVSALPQRAWRTVIDMRLSDGLPLLIIAAMLLVWLQLMLIDWDQTLAGIKLEWLGLYRPEWLLAANLVASVTFTGVIATRLLRCAGAATVAGLLALAIRYALIQLFDAEMLQYVAWVAALLPMLAIDLWAYYCSAIRKTEPEWRGTAAAVIVAMAVNAFVIRSLYPLDFSDTLAYGLAVVVTGIGMSWLSHQIADAMQRKRQAIDAEPSEGRAMTPQFSFGVLAAFVLFIVFFISTASPPV